MCQAIGAVSRPAATTAHGAVPAGSAPPVRARRPSTTNVATSSSPPATVPTVEDNPNRTATPGSAALSTTSGTAVVRPIRSHSTPLDQPAAATPTSVATAAPATPATPGRHRPCTKGNNRTGANDGLNATATPYSTAASIGRPRRSAIQPAASATSSSP
ncbi:hypothetical protein PSU4_40950 [Pseudonocardia sulfidoxydans NBRC 16205]|uniref:Uncharacterized protein n=1 Tax=Pseudonocardia sulfidoxydans NBRC 16205 TaxID=1223511 RepID=A0A511DK06_9PSEU|nr:hypothetical protein PSU4_40950 [Pseudonocardia sulfidoxydans NBRC 16205]